MEELIGAQSPAARTQRDQRRGEILKACEISTMRAAGVLAWL
jgi:hypothetical protein